MVNPANQTLRIKNFSAAPINIATYRLCALFENTALNSSNVSIVSGDFFLTQNEEVVLNWDALNGLNTVASDLGLYLPTGGFDSASSMVDFMQYGASGQGRENVAMTAGLWTSGSFLPTNSGPWVYNGNGVQSGISFWVSAAEVTFKVNMALQTVSANGVHIAGNFQNWNPSNTLMLDLDNDAVYEYSTLLAAGSQIQFKFINGNAWGPTLDESVPSACGVPNGQGGFNRFATVIASGSQILGPVCFAQCANCVIPGCIDTSACNYDVQATVADSSCTFAGCLDSTAINYNANAGCAAPCVYADVNVTFKVNMANTTVSPDGVHLAGSIQGWNPSATQMTDLDNDSIYEVTLPAASNQLYQFKFINGNDWAFEESVPSNCGIANTVGGFDREILVDSNDVVFGPVCFGACVDCGDIITGCIDTTACNYDSLANTSDNSCVYAGCLDSTAFNFNANAGCDAPCLYPDVNVTFKVNMANTTVSADGVHLAGSIQGWNPSTTPMTDLDNDGIYEVTLQAVVNQSYQFKFINGNDWTMAEQVPAVCGIDDFFGAYNREIFVDSNDFVFGPVCFGACVNCGDIIIGCIDTTACNYDSLANTSDNSCVYPGCLDSTAFNYSANAGCSAPCVYADVNVTFKVNMANATVSPDGVHLAGSIQGWNPSATQMTDLDNDSIYEVTLQAAANQSYQFKFINGNDWPFEESVPSDCGIANTVGGFDREILVGSNDIVFGPVCFGACVDCGDIITGCIDTTACNYDSLANTADTSCVYPGCLDSTAFNYNPNAGCASQCVYADVIVTFKVNMANTTVSPDGVHLAGSIQGWNPSTTPMTDSDNDGIYEVTLQAIANQLYQFKFINGNDWPWSEQIPSDCGMNDGFGGYNREILVDSNDVVFGPVCFGACINCVEIIAGCVDTTACNYDPSANVALDSVCVYPGCMDLSACNYDSAAFCSDSSCVYPGCMDVSACNYDSAAGCQGNVICILPDGCTDTNACNFNAAATCDDGSCHFDVSVDIVLSIDSSGSVVFEETMYVPGIYTFTYTASNGCDSLVTLVVIDPSVEGCTDATACNYDPTAGIASDSLCVYPGCMDVTACNYDAVATCDGGVCYFDVEVSLTQLFSSPFIFNDSLINQPGVYEFELTTQAGCDSLLTLIVLDPSITDCADSSACNYNPLAGVVANFMCVYPGCTDSLACNYSNAAGCSDNSCSYPGCMNVASCNYDVAAGCDDGSCTFPGCTTETACNYDVNAGCDDGSCEALIGALCDDGDTLTVGDSITTGCLCVGDSVSISITEALNNDLLIYPNPAEDRIFIQMSGMNSATLQLISLTGELVYSGKALHELMVNQLSPGIYLLQIDNMGIRSNQRIEIIR